MPFFSCFVFYCRLKFNFYVEGKKISAAGDLRLMRSKVIGRPIDGSGFYISPWVVMNMNATTNTMIEVVIYHQLEHINNFPRGNTRPIIMIKGEGLHRCFQATSIVTSKFGCI